MKKILIILIFLITLFTANLVYAVGIHTGPLVPCGRAGQPDCTLCDLWVLGSNLINFISFNLAIPAATLLFVTAGVFFLISGGSEDKVARAKTIFTNTVIGLIIIFCSWLIIDTLFKTIATGAFRTAWNDIPICSVKP